MKGGGQARRNGMGAPSDDGSPFAPSNSAGVFGIASIT
jgi:hypothetical protein